MKLIIDFYNRKIVMTNWELYIFKLSILFLSLAIGCYFADFIRPYLIPIIIVGVLMTIWITGVWLKALKQTK